MKPNTSMALTTALVIGIGFTIGCSSSTPTQTTAKAAQTANLQSVTFFVDGMV